MTSTTTTTSDIAAAYYQRGWVPIVVPRGTKAPITEGWPQTTWADVAAVRQAFSAPSNIGLLLGEPSHGLVDVDLDCPEALALAAIFLPATRVVSGRTCRRHSHWWYTVTPSTIRTQKFQYALPEETSKTTVVELRATGGHTLVPPSIHPDGDDYLWEGPDPVEDTVPSTLPAATLLQRVAAIAIGALLARFWPPTGTKHDATLPIAGMFYNLDWPQDEAETLVFHAAQVAGHSLPHDRRRVVTDTYHNAKSGRHIQGIPKLKTLFPPVIVDTLVTWCAMVHPHTTNGHARTPHHDDPWEAPTPLPTLLPPVPTLPTDLLPDPLKPWLVDVTERFQIPLEFTAIPAVTSLSAVVGRQCGIYPKRADDWVVVPNLWGMVVGRPGVLKTPAMQEALKPLDRLAAQAREQHAHGMIEVATRGEIHKAQREALRAAMKAAAKDGDVEMLEKLRLELVVLEQAATALVPIERRFKVGDPTVEKLGELLKDNPVGLLLFRDELAGWLRSLDKSGREGDREFYLEAWNGTGEYTVDRIERGTLHIPAMCLSLLGSIQPGKLAAYVADALQGGAGDDGLLQRFQLAVWPDITDWTNVDRPPNRVARQHVHMLFARLAHLHAQDLGATAEEEGAVPALRFAPDAQELFDEWRTELECRLRSGVLESSAFEEHLSKYRSLMPSLALLFHLADQASDSFVSASHTHIRLKNAQLAAAWCEFLEGHARRIYAGVLQADLQAAHALLHHIRRGEVHTGDPVRTLYRRQWSLLRTPDMVGAALVVLERHHVLRVCFQETGGRRSEIVLLNPRLTQTEDM